MKNVLMLLMVAFFSVVITHNSHAGSEAGNGGDYLAMEFATSGRRVYEALSKLNTRNLHFNLSALQNSIENSAIKSTCETLVDDDGFKECHELSHKTDQAQESSYLGL